LWALYAAALDGRVAAVAAQDALYSYVCLLAHGASYPASVYLFDLLKKYDLAQVIAACAPRPVYLRPVDGWRRPCTKRVVTSALQTAVNAFSQAGADPNGFQIASLENARNIPMWLDEVLNQ